MKVTVHEWPERLAEQRRSHLTAIPSTIVEVMFGRRDCQAEPALMRCWIGPGCTAEAVAKLMIYEAGRKLMTFRPSELVVLD